MLASERVSELAFVLSHVRRKDKNAPNLWHPLFLAS